jgi:hypothetical protein
MKLLPKKKCADTPSGFTIPNEKDKKVVVANTNGSLLYVLFFTKSVVSPNGMSGRVATIQRLGAVDIWHRETCFGCD